MTLTCLNKTEKPYKRKFLKKLKRVTTNIEAKKNQDLETTRRSYATRRLKIEEIMIVLYRQADKQTDKQTDKNVD